MKTNAFLISFFVAVIFILTACPYQSQVPIDVPNQKIDKTIIGKWVKNSEADKENPEYFQISELDTYKYNIVKFEYQSNDSTYKQTKYLTHFTKIEDYVFMNMQQDGEGDFYLHRIDMNGDEFTLYELTDNIDEKFASSEELKKFVEKNMKLSFFYNKDEIKYVREK
ncbi:MAG: hypothetical protein JXR51_05915 [Bacteroidales bacterium]|nr:hypothetical protein [Bacteroidales bacterium]MBN2756697.1 hypothetical protein [Bacteroidales bacterium]